jgi:hypothetical protein
MPVKGRLGGKPSSPAGPAELFTGSVRWMLQAMRVAAPSDQGHNAMNDNKITRDGRVVETRSSSTPAWLLGLIVIALLVVAAFAFGLINIDQTREAVAPTVKLETSGGQAPVFDVQTADVDVGTKTETVEVPTINVQPAGDPNAKN